MAQFIGELKLSPSKKNYWKTAEEFTYIMDNGEKVVVPKDFDTDGASVPRFFWRIIGHPFMGSYAKAAVVHDYLYKTQILSKTEADLIFLDIMKFDNVKLWRRTLMYYAVKWFGSIAWKSHQKSKDL